MQQDQVFVLKKKPYRSTGYMVTFFMRSHGVCRLFASQKSTMYKLNLFEKMQAELGEDAELKRTTALELQKLYPILDHHLISALYLNELVLNMISNESDQMHLFGVYEKVLALLSAGVSGPALHWLMRYFELHILMHTGYEIDARISSTQVGEALTSIYRSEHVVQKFVPLLNPCKLFLRQVIDEVTEGRVAYFRRICGQISATEC